MDPNQDAMNGPGCATRVKQTTFEDPKKKTKTTAPGMSKQIPILSGYLLSGKFSSSEGELSWREQIKSRIYCRWEFLQQDEVKLKINSRLKSVPQA